jgi:uncharacterized protein (DUF2141 family)
MRRSTMLLRGLRPAALATIAALSASAALSGGFAAAQTGKDRASPAAAAAGSVLEVRVGKVRNGRGRVHVDICTADQFLKDCPYSAEAPAMAGATTVKVRNLPPGLYAAQVFHDENGSGDVERNFLGLPKEGVGFSKITRKLLRAPRFREAAFRYDGGPTTVTADLHYYVG